MYAHSSVYVFIVSLNHSLNYFNAIYIHKKQKGVTGLIASSECEEQSFLEKQKAFLVSCSGEGCATKLTAWTLTLL